MAVDEICFKGQTSVDTVCWYYSYSEGEVSKDNMISFLKTIKEAENLSEEDAAKIAAARIQDSKPKSRMYYKIGASREIGGSKKIDAKSFLTSKLRVFWKYKLTKSN